MRRITIFGRMAHWKEQIKSWIAKRKRDPYRGLSHKERFERIYRSNDWQDDESVSGPGSNAEQTQVLLGIMAEVLERVKPSMLVDIPCGDFSWMQKVPFDTCKYIGGDIVEELIQQNQNRFGCDVRRFEVIDLLQDPLPSGDILLVRDCLVHLNNEQIRLALQRIKKSNCKYLLTTTFTNDHVNFDIHTGDWRPINLELAPFHFPKPMFLFNEQNTENEGKYSDKSLGLWAIKDLPNYE